MSDGESGVDRRKVPDVAAVSIGCEECAGSHGGEFYEVIVGGRLHWVLDYVCGGRPVEAMGWERSPEEWRVALLEQCGPYRLTLPEGVGGSRVAVLKALRDGGLAWAEVAQGLDALLRRGIAGTYAEMRILADRVEAAAPVRCVVGGGAGDAVG